jgi:hypothetical protein
MPFSINGAVFPFYSIATKFGASQWVLKLHSDQSMVPANENLNSTTTDLWFQLVFLALHRDQL